MLRPLRRKPRIPDLYTYDLEWYPQTLQLRMVGFFDGHAYRAFRDVESFFEHVLTGRYHGGRFYAHFGGRFDIVYLLPTLLRAKYKVELMFSGSSVVRARVERGRYWWDFCDSQFLLKVSLKALGESVGLEKLDCPFDAPWDELEEYNRRDCEILYRALSWSLRLITDLGGELKYTLASTAMHLFRSQFLRAPIVTQRTLNAVVRPAYIASRVEDIRRRSSAGYCYDVNSSFPFSMQVAPLPGDLTVINRKRGDLAIVRAKVKVPDMFLPPLPYRPHAGGRIYFPVGEWEGWFASPDLDLLEEAGGRTMIILEAYHFAPRTEFGDYVRTIYPLRQEETDEFRRYFLKILLNALYGKTAERELKEHFIFHPTFTSCPHDGEHIEDGISTCLRRVRPGVIAVREVRAVPHAHVPVAAITTSRSRATLTRAAWRAEQLAYLDTDSIHSVTQYASSSALGDLKFEYAYQEGLFLGPKAYSVAPDEAYRTKAKMGDNRYMVKMKGFPRMSREQFEGLARGQGITFEQFRGPRLALRDGERGGMKLESITKRLHSICTLCGREAKQGTCRDHGADYVSFSSKVQAKRCHEGDSSRPWHVSELVGS